MSVRSRLERTLVAILVLALAGIVAVVAPAPGGTRGPSSGFDGPVMPAGVRAAAFSLTDQYGRRVNLAQMRGRVVLVAFIHSKCRSTCSLAAWTIGGALDLLPPSVAGQVSAVAISAAPAEDTPRSRRAFVALHHLDGRLEYLNGARPDLSRVWNAYHVLPEPANDRNDVHTTFTMLIDRSGLERVGFPDAEMTPETLAHDLRLLVAQRS